MARNLLVIIGSGMKIELHTRPLWLFYRLIVKLKDNGLECTVARQKARLVSFKTVLYDTAKSA